MYDHVCICSWKCPLVLAMVTQAMMMLLARMPVLAPVPVVLIWSCCGGRGGDHRSRQKKTHDTVETKRI